MDFQFAYRAPQKMLGTLGAPASRSYAWDGEHLMERSDAASEASSPTRTSCRPEQARGRASPRSSPPSPPEGFRAPLLPGKGVSARRVSHPRGPEAVELTVKPEGTDGEVTVRAALARHGLPGQAHRQRRRQLGDSRRGGGSASRPCGLCVPQRLTQWAGEQQVAETTLSRVDARPRPCPRRPSRSARPRVTKSSRRRSWWPGRRVAPSGVEAFQGRPHLPRREGVRAPWPWCGTSSSMWTARWWIRWTSTPRPGGAPSWSSAGTCPSRTCAARLARERTSSLPVFFTEDELEKFGQELERLPRRRSSSASSCPSCAPSRRCASCSSALARDDVKVSLGLQREGRRAGVLREAVRHRGT